MKTRIVTALNDVSYKGAFATISKIEEEKITFFGKTKVKLLGYTYGLDYPEGVNISKLFEDEDECRKEALRELVFVEDHYKLYYESQLYRRA